MNMGLYAREYPSEAAGLVMVDAAHEAIYLAPIRFVQACVTESTTYKAREVQAAPPMLPIPLIVIEHGNPGGVPRQVEPRWHALQQDLASRSPRSKLIVAERSTHTIQSSQPDLVVAAVQEIVEEVR